MSESRPRSRSRTSTSNTSGLAEPSAHRSSAADHAPVTGIAICDKWFYQFVTDQKVQAEFMEMPEASRKRVVLKAMDAPPQNPNMWFNACNRNHRDRMLEQRVTGGASVYGQGSNRFPPLQSAAAGYSSGGAPASCPAGSHSRAQPTCSTVAVTPHVQVSSCLGTPPPWAVEICDLWPKNKSQLLARCYDMLEVDVATRMQQCEPLTQSAIAYVAALTATTCDTTPNTFLRACLTRVLRPDAGGVPPTASSGEAHPEEEAGALTVQLVVFGRNPLINVLLASTFIRSMPHFQKELDWISLPVVCITSEDPEHTLTAAVAKRMRLNVNLAVRDLAALRTHCRALIGPHDTVGAKRFLFLHYLDNDVFSECGTSVLVGSAPLHCSAARWFWQGCALSVELRKKHGDQAVAEACLYPDHCLQPVDDLLSTLFGTLVVGPPAAQSGTVAPVPKAVCIPRGVVSMPVSNDQQCPEAEIDGWSVSPPGAVPPLMRPCLLKNLLQAQAAALFQDRCLAEHEKASLLMFTMRYGASGEERSWSRDRWLRFYGLHATPFKALVDEMKPCLSLIVPVTGTKATEGSPAASPCGKLRYCLHCEQVLGMLDQMYHFPTVIDIMVAVANKAASMWKGQEVGGAWERTLCDGRVHECSASCPQARGGQA